MRSKCSPPALTICSLLLCAIAAAAFADNLDAVAKPAQYVTDAAAVVDADSATAMNALLEEVERLTTAQVLVVTVDTTGGSPALDYALRLANRWRLGVRGVDNGVLVLVAVKDRDYAVAVGDGLRNVLSDSFLSQTAQRLLPPAFSRGQYGQGLRDLAEAVALKLEPNYGVSFASVRAASRHSRPAPRKPSSSEPASSLSAFPRAAPQQPAPREPAPGQSVSPEPAPSHSAAYRPSLPAEADPYSPAPAVPSRSLAPAARNSSYSRPRRQAAWFLIVLAGVGITAAAAMILVVLARVKRTGVFSGFSRAVERLADSLAAQAAQASERAREESGDGGLFDAGFWSSRRPGAFSGGIFGEGFARGPSFGQSHHRVSHSSSFGQSHSGISHSGSFGGHSAGIGRSTGHFGGGAGGHSSGGVSGKW